MARTIAPHLTPAHLRKMFDSYDENHDGTVSREEVEHALARLELPVTYAAQIFARVDTNGDGLLDFKEFEHYVHETEEEFRKLFDLIDTDGDGSISAKELALAMEKLHLHAKIVAIQTEARPAVQSTQPPMPCMRSVRSTQSAALMVLPWTRA